MAFIFLSIATGFLALACAVPFSRCEAWWVRGFEFPRLQFAVAGLLVIALSLVFLDLEEWRSWAVIGLGGLTLAVQGWWIAPYTVLRPVEVRAAQDGPGHETLTMMTANVLTPNRGAEGLLKMVRQSGVDVLVTLESDQWWEDQLDVLEAEGYEHTIKCPLDNLYGMHVYSRLPLSECETQFLVKPEIPSMHALAHLRSGREVRMHFLHPEPPSPTENPESSERDAELVMVARSVADSSQPVVVTGDLNDVAWSTTTRLFRKISGLLDPRVGRGMFSTYHAKYSFMRWPLDHLFHSDHFTLGKITRLPGFGSDHFPLLTVLVFEPDRGSEQSGLEPEKEDRVLADAKIEDEGVDEEAVATPGEKS